MTMDRDGVLISPKTLPVDPVLPPVEPDTSSEFRRPEAARVDYLIDDSGNRVHVPENSAIRNTGSTEAAVGGTSPASWSRWAIMILGALILIIALWQVFGGAPGTDVQPGSPTAQPVVEPVLELPAEQL